jgi:Methyltransferase domain
MGLVKSAIKTVLPKSIMRAYNDYVRAKLTDLHGRMTTEEVFTEIYSRNRWGGSSGTFCSGPGSHDVAVVSPYVACVTAELDKIGAASMTAIDLGCGDFSVGRQLAAACGRYIGVDIVKPLVAHNNTSYGDHRIAFCHANIVEDELPEGDICFVRQVLQHLSNDQIATVLPKLNNYRWCFITEHHPSADRLDRPNEDKTHGGDIRISGRSGVFLEEPPFAIPATRYKLLLEVPGIAPIDAADRGVIRTYLLTRDCSAGDGGTQALS